MAGRISQLCCVMAVLSCTKASPSPYSSSWSGANPEVVIIRTEAHRNVTLLCPGVHEGTLVTTLKWTLGLQKLVEFMSETTTVWEHRHRINLLSETFGLHFHPVLSSDSGEYSCLVNNRPNPDALVQLIVLDVPGPPGRPLILGFTSRSTNLSWAPPSTMNNSPIKHYLIHVRVGEDGEWDVNNAIRTADNSTMYTIGDLSPFTVYSFRVVAVNALGPSEPGKESYYMFTLREVPQGKPTVTAAYNMSSSSIHIEWEPPPKETIHGEFLGYRIYYRPRDKQPHEATEILLRDPNAKGHIIRDLETYTQYLVSIQAFNPEGGGPMSTVLVMTDEGEPSKPLTVAVVNASSTWIQVHWDRPEHANGDIRGYRIYYMHGNITDVRTSASSAAEFTLTGLKPYTEYKVWVIAFTFKYEGQPSDPVRHRTDIAGPSPPQITNISCHDNSSIFVEWRPSEHYFNSVDQYIVIYRIDGETEEEEFILNPSEYPDNSLLSIVLDSLEWDIVYHIRVVGATRSVYYDGVYIRGNSLEPRAVTVRQICERLRTPFSEMGLPVEPSLLIAIIGICLLLIFLILFVVFWRRCCKRRYCYLDGEGSRRGNSSMCDWDQRKDSQAIPMESFPKHVASLHADGDIGFSKEYEMIQNSVPTDQFTSIVSQHPDNKQKNRYLNILAYDHTRVQFMPLPGQDISNEYINANFIDGFQKGCAYIGTQGPLPLTFSTFWRMVWEQRVFIIVMITNLIERGRRKCDMYWPKEGTENHGLISVTLVKEEVRATYTIRTLRLVHQKVKKRKHHSLGRLVYQYHYTNWPDHGTPDHPLPILRFIVKSSSANPSNAGPIVVHCSAGVGRTGAYIVLDSMLKQIKKKQQVDVCGFLKHIRTQRNFLVQTEEQYIFLHDALVEAIESGDTCVHYGYLSRYMSQLVANPQCDKTLPGVMLDNQYKLVTAFKPDDYHLMSAHKSMNVAKNGINGILPVEFYRVHLTPKPGLDGSDYVNASWLIGYQKLREFIVTGLPCDYSLMDFWQMIWDHSVQTIVVLYNFDNELDPFWPPGVTVLESEAYRLKFLTDKDSRVLDASGAVATQDLLFQSVRDDYEWSVRLFFLPTWPHACSPLSAAFDAIKAVQEWNRDPMRGPICVVDSNGSTRAATFCLLTTAMKQLMYEGYVDIYTYAKIYHMCRPGVWQAVNDFLFLYEAIVAFAETHTAELAKVNPADVAAPSPVGLGPTPDIHANGYVRFKCGQNIENIENGISNEEDDEDLDEMTCSSGRYLNLDDRGLIEG